MKHSDAAKIKMSKSRIGLKWTEEARKNFREANSGNKHWNYGKQLSQEHKEKLSKSLSGVNNPNFGSHMSLEQKQKISNSKIGTKASQATKDKLSTNVRGENHPLTILTNEKVREIKNLLLTQKVLDIANKFNVSKTVIYKIKNRITWTHIT
jgi:hypothetical protein